MAPGGPRQGGALPSAAAPLCGSRKWGGRRGNAAVFTGGRGRHQGGRCEAAGPGRGAGDWGQRWAVGAGLGSAVGLGTG